MHLLYVTVLFLSYSRLSKMNSLVERLIVVYSEEDNDSSSSLSFNDTCSVLMKNLCKDVWPCLAVMGGVNSGFRVGGTCGIDTSDNDVKKGVVIGEKDGVIKVQEMTDDSENGSIGSKNM